MGHPGYFIVPFDPIESMQDEPFYAVGQSIFTDSLKAKWTRARIYKKKITVSETSTEQSGNIEYVLEWNIPSVGNEYLFGRHNMNIAVTFEAYPQETVVEFVLWYRQLVPENIQLYFSSIVLSDALLLTNQTTSDDIMKTMGVSL